MPFSPKLRAYTRRQLEGRGVDIRLNTRIREVTPGSRAAGGRDVAAERPHGLDGRGGRATAPSPPGACRRARAGRLLIGPDLRVQGTDRIFAAGDIALDEDEPVAAARAARAAGGQARRRADHPPAARRADRAVPLPRQGHHGDDRPPLRRGAAGRAAPASPGRFAWFAWLALHLVYLLGGRNRIATLINLSWRYIAWGHGGGVIVGDEPTEPLHGETSQAARAGVAGTGAYY